MEREPLELVGQGLQWAISPYLLLPGLCHLLYKTIQPEPKTLKVEATFSMGELVKP
jgi:hypothetical protein